MPTIQINVAGVAGQCTLIGAMADEATQSTAGYLSQSAGHQGELDGAARACAEELTISAERAVSAALETEHSLRTFLQNAAEAVDTVDQRQAGSFTSASGTFSGRSGTWTNAHTHSRIDHFNNALVSAGMDKISWDTFTNDPAAAAAAFSNLAPHQISTLSTDIDYD